MAVPKEHHSIVERLAQLIEDGSVVPSVDRTYPLSDAATAMRQLVAGQARGKLVITI
jgi:NADPH:quinone reductase-like Zn-dependent oxidoreductase